MRFPNHLGGEVVSQSLKDDMLRGYKTIIIEGKVDGIEPLTQRVYFSCNIGGNPNNPAQLMKIKASTDLAGYNDMPNIGDKCVIAFLNGNFATPIILGFIESKDPIKTSIAYDELGLSADPDTASQELIHLLYRKHETGSFFSLNKIGKFVAKLFKKASTEADPAKANVKLDIDNLGNVDAILYKSDGTTKAVELTLDALGNIILTNPKFTLSIDKDGKVDITTDKDVNLTSSGKVKVSATEIDLDCDGTDPLTGVITGNSTCPFTGLPHIMPSTKVKAGS